MDQSVHTAQIDEYTVRGDVLDRTFEYLTLFELGDDLLLLLLEVGLDEGLVRDHHVLEVVVYLDDLEFHRLFHELIVIADRFYVDLRAGQEGLDAEHIDDHTALGAAFDETVDDLARFVRCVHAVPSLDGASLLVREHQLAVLVFLTVHQDFHLVAYSQCRIVAELGSRDHAFGLGIDVHDHLAVILCHHRTFDHFVFVHTAQRVDVELLHLVMLGFRYFGSGFVSIPVEILERVYVFRFF